MTAAAGCGVEAHTIRQYGLGYGCAAGAGRPGRRGTLVSKAQPDGDLRPMYRMPVRGRSQPQPCPMEMSIQHTSFPGPEQSSWSWTQECLPWTVQARGVKTADRHVGCACLLDSLSDWQLMPHRAVPLCATPRRALPGCRLRGGWAGCMLDSSTICEVIHPLPGGLWR